MCYGFHLVLAPQAQLPLSEEPKLTHVEGPEAPLTASTTR